MHLHSFHASHSPRRWAGLNSALRVHWIGMVLLTMVPPILGQQERDFTELLSGKNLPLSLTLKELSADWRRVTVQGSGAVSGNVSVNVNGNSLAATSQNNLTGSLASSRSYLTKGETVTIKARVYLVAYHLASAGLDIGRLLQTVAMKAQPSSAALTLDSALPLSLLDLTSAGSLEDVRPFDAKEVIAESQNAVRALSELFKSQNQGGSASTNSSPAKKGGADEEEEE